MILKTSNLISISISFNPDKHVYAHIFKDGVWNTPAVLQNAVFNWGSCIVEV